jgi:hypothetical protein
MLIRSEESGFTAIGQASHAWLSGQIARAWGGGRFERPVPYEEVCLAAEQHDVGMAEWDLAPLLQPRTGRPQSFMEMALQDHLALWSRAPSKLATQSRYAALLVSHHGTALYEHRDQSQMSPADAAAVRAYLAREGEWQRRELGLLAADPVQLGRNQRLLWAWDGLSLAVCLGWPEHVIDDVPAADGARVTLRLHPTPADARSFVLEPWPFRAAEVDLRCEGRRLIERHDTAAGLHAALERAAPLTLRFKLTPPSRSRS